jgi:hypothetical protein
MPTATPIGSDQSGRSCKRWQHENQMMFAELTLAKDWIGT